MGAFVLFIDDFCKMFNPKPKKNSVAKNKLKRITLQFIPSLGEPNEKNSLHPNWFGFFSF